LTENLLDEDVRRYPYAILSHTWGQPNEEVTFEDMVEGCGLGKAGYEKIKFCDEQAAKDGLQYFWVDSCCIKKSSDAELSESLNSMFRWYQRATKCYVRLSDVSTTKGKRRNGNLLETWEQAFRESRWFTRGWTLQELLAPQSVEFFSKEGSRLGDKQSLEQQIHEVTRVPISVLRGFALSHFSADQKFDWAKNRQTTREEDWAYSLLGIFEISMPVTYGEGRANAVRRLRKEIDDTWKDKECLRHLYVTDPRKDKIRIEETKGGLILDSYRWILENRDFKEWHDDQQSHLLWIKGDPGKGKTMLLCGIIDELKKSTAKTHLLSFFYCQATDSRTNNATAVLRGLLYLLINQQPSLISHVQKQHDHAGRTLFEDANAWVALSEIFTNALQDPSLRSTYFIIDALDECMRDLPKLLDFIIEKSSVSPHVKWLVSSRNWPYIEGRLHRAESKVRLCLELNAESVSAAVNIYIWHKVRQLAQDKEYDDKTRDAVHDHISSNANNTFLWAALVCQFLQEVDPWNVLTKLNEFPTGLGPLYRRMMEQIDSSDNADLCKRILASTAIVYRPVTLKELASLVHMPKNISQNLKWLARIIGHCGSFLTIHQDVVSFVHQSAKDFLLTEASNKIFASGKEQTHYEILSRSLEVMSKTLRRDIYGLDSLGYPIESVKKPDPDPLASSRYSCIYWVDHLCDWNFDCHAAQGTVDLQDGGIVDVFMRKRFLYWLEALSLCRNMPKGMLSMEKLETFLLTLFKGRPDAAALLELVGDARRFIMYNKQAIEISPLQAYSSALIFSPTGSLTRRHFRREEPQWITIKPTTTVVEKWSECLQTLKSHSSWVNSVAFSQDSTRLASASDDGTVRIWDAHGGECLHTLEGHSSWVRSVVFSHDSGRLASASHDRTVRIWDANSGECLQRLKGHSSGVNSVAFSHNSIRLASASHDGIVQIWDASNSEYLQTLKGHNSGVNSVAFSHDSTWLASALDDGTVRIWDASSGECLQTLKGHSSGVNSVAFSQDSGRLASASYDSTVRIWDASSGECLQTLEGHSSWVNSAAFSRDSTRLASASHDGTVRIWDASSGECLQTLEGDSSWVSLVTFSHDSTRLLSASNDGTVRIWDASSGECLQTLEGHSSWVSWVTFSYDSIRLASASHDNTVRIWDASSGKCLQTLKDHSNSVSSVAFSYDSTRLASASHDHTVRIWDASSGKCLQTLKGHSSGVNSVAFPHDSTRLASASHDRTVRIWDASSGECLQTLEGHSSWVNSVAFSHDSTRLASASHDSTVRIWDARSGECLQTLSIGKTLYKISFDSTGSHLHTDIGTVTLSISSTSNITPDEMEPQIPRYQGVALSSDGAWITYNSKNLVWLPCEYRPSCSAVSGKTVGIGVGSGRVWICSIQVVGTEHD